MKRIIEQFCALVAVFCVACRGGASLVTWSASPDALIPDNSPGLGAASDIYVAPGDSQLSGIAQPSVASVTGIHFTITGGWDGDYTVVLMHTDGTASQSVTLLDMLLGGAAANSGFDNVTLAAGNPDINSAGSRSSTAAVSGAYSPQGGVTFSSFHNVSPTGDWLLYVTDNAAGDRGVLTSWSLDLDVVPEPVNTALMVSGGLALLLALAKCRRSGRQAGWN